MLNNNCSNLVLQQETVHEDGILSACKRYYLCCKAGQWKCPTLLFDMKEKTFFPAPESWGTEMVSGPGKSVPFLFEGKDTSFFTYQPCHCPQARVFCCWRGRKTLLSLCFLEVMTSTGPNSFCSTKSTVKEVSFQGFRTAEGSLCIGKCAEMD